MRVMKHAVGVGGALALAVSSIVLLVAGAAGGEERFLVALAVAVSLASIAAAIGVLLVVVRGVRWDAIYMYRVFAIAIAVASLVLSRGGRCSAENTLPFVAALAPVIALVLVVRALAAREHVKHEIAVLVLACVAVLAARAQPGPMPCPAHECAPEIFTFGVPCTGPELKRLVLR
jgi:hypothetical protein